MKTLRFLNLLPALFWIPAAAQTTATVDIDTTKSIHLNPGFGGVNDEVSDPIEYWDYRFNALAARLHYGWVRFPGGITGDAYNWQTGQEEPSWVAQFASNKTAGVLLPETSKWLAGKGGGRLLDAANRANIFGASLVLCVNAFTDTPDSIGQMAAYAKANGIRVAVWELANEPYNLTEFFPNGTTYLNKVKPFRDAIKAADPTALVAIFADDPGRGTNANPPWDRAIAAYADKYWDAVTYHYYAPQSTGPFANWMADSNAVLVTKTDGFVTGHLAQMNNPPGTKYLVSEFNPSQGNAGGTSPTDSLTNGTLYGGIYAAEFTMRMSTLPQVLCVGPHAISSFAGMMSTNEHYPDVTAAANAGTTIDTLSLNFGYYYAAEAVGLGIAYGVINNSVQSNKTTVTGGATVPATGVPQIPALYAMSYTNAAGGLSLLITNKSTTAHRVTIRTDGNAAAGPFPIQFVTGADPSVMNTRTSPSSVKLQTATSTNPVTVPPYSVVRVDVSTPPVATFVHAATRQPGPLAPSQQVTVLATGLAGAALTITDTAGTQWPLTLDSTTSSEATFVLPDVIAPGPASVTVMRVADAVLTGQIAIATSAPGIYTANNNGAGVASAVISQSPVYTCQDNVPLSCLEAPIDLGDGSNPVTLTISATGIRGAQSVQVYVAGQPVPLLDFMPQQTSGQDQVDVTIPSSLSGAGEVSLYLIVDGSMSNVASLKIM